MRIESAYAAGLVAERARSFGVFALGLFAASLVILVLGGLWLGIGSGIALWPEAKGSGLVYGVTAGILPFLPMDVVKALAAAAVAWPAVKRSE